MRFNLPQTIIEAVLALIYVFVLFIIVTSKKHVFKNAFYSMFVTTGIADVTSIIVCCLFRINSQANSLGPEFRPLFLLCGILSTSSFVAHMFGNMLITVNRFSALCLKDKYEKIWSLRNVRIVIVLHIAVAFSASTPLFGAEFLFTLNEDGTYTFMGLDRRSDMINRCTYVGASLFYALVSLILNVRLMIELHKLLKISDFGRHSRHEKGMALYTMLVFSFTTLMCTQQIVKGIATITENTALAMFINMQYYWINDVMVSIPPLSLLMFNGELRKDMVNFICCRRHQQRDNISVSIFENRQSVSGLNKDNDRRNATRSVY